jgi:ribonucleoside-diphosphate reductase alpha chain
MGEKGKTRRKSMDSERSGSTHKFAICCESKTGEPEWIKGYLIHNVYDDGQLGEIFIRLGKSGETLMGLLDGFATAVSIGLQHGVPLLTFVEKFKNMRFEPSGMTKSADIPIAKSILDYIFTYLERKYCKAD